VIIKLGCTNQQVRVKLTKSFWNRCPELRSAKIGHRLIQNHLAPWLKNNPPSLKLLPLQGNQFILYIMSLKFPKKTFCCIIKKILSLFGVDKIFLL